MLRHRFVITMIVMLVIAYLGALAVSTAHLSQVYQLYNTGLPYWVSIGLAVALEACAFLFSLISTSLGNQAGPWPAWASTSALLLVWAGNGYAMLLAAPTRPIVVTVFASCFVPVCTLLGGKVLGGLFGLLDRLGQPERANEKRRQEDASAAAVVASQPAAQGPASLWGQQRPVAAASPIRQSPPPSVRRPAIAGESPVFRPDTSAASNIGTSEAAVPFPVPAISSRSSAAAGDSSISAVDHFSTTGATVPVLETEVKDKPPEATALQPNGVTMNMSSAPKRQPELPVAVKQAPQEPKPPVHSAPVQEDPGAPEPTAAVIVPPPEMSSTALHSGSVPDSTRSGQRRNRSKSPVPESELAPAQATSNSPRRAKADSASARKAKLDLIGVGTLSDEALARVGLSRPELVELAALVTARWPQSNTERLLSPEKAVLAWAYVAAKASKSALAVELGLGEKEWVVRDTVKSVETVLGTVRTPDEDGAETRHVHVPDQKGESPEAAAGDAQGPVEFGSTDVNMGEQGGQA